MMKQFEENYAVRDKQDVLYVLYNLRRNQNKNRLITLLMVKKLLKELKKCALDQYLDN
jgi:hypothetical protein